MGGFFTLCQPPITQPPTPLSETIKGRVFFRGGIILTMTGMNTVPIVQVLSTPCCSHGTNYRIILKIYLSTLMGCVKKNLLYVLSYKKNTLKEHSKFKKKNIYDL